MKQDSEDEQALIKIQHDWAEARIKGDSSQGYDWAHEGKQNLLGGNRRGPGHDQGPRGKTKSSWREICRDGYIYETAWRMEGGRITNNSSLKEIVVNDRRYSL